MQPLFASDRGPQQRRSLILPVSLLLLFCLPLSAEASFRFAVAADQRSFTGPGVYDTLEYFRGACRAIDAFGPVDFLISPGDIDPPENSEWTIRQYIDPDYLWYPVVGNHELPGAGNEAYEGANMDWLRAYDYDSNGPGVPPDLVNSGPSGCPGTTFSFDYENAHFVVLNEYCDSAGDDVTGGDIPDHLYDWLTADLDSTTQEHVFIFGHEPAYPQPDADNHRARHLGDCLNEHPVNRDRFWDLLGSEGVTAYICGHTHNFSTLYTGGVWQLDAGHARGAGDPGAPSTFLIIDVDGGVVTFDAFRETYQGAQDYVDLVHHGVLAPAPSTQTLVPRGSDWRYLDDGTDQGSAWPAPDFDDTGWAGGPAELGYGDGDEATPVSFGTDPANKHVTTYFRHTFMVADPLDRSGFWLRLLRDDGAVVHLNGTELCRSSMPAGPVTYQTLAAETAGGAKETAFLEYEIDSGLLTAGTNVLAVEIHQAAVTSSDISFDLELLSYTWPTVVVSSQLTCTPSSGTLPLEAQFTVTMNNHYSGTARRLAAHLDVLLADGAEFSNWRSGHTNVTAGGSFSTSWSQFLPAQPSLAGVNRFSLTSEDVTPSPWNHPPYPPAGETDISICTVTGTAP